MVAAVLTLVWRQVPSVQELTRLLEREDLLWCRARKVAQKSLSERLLEFPASIFEKAKSSVKILQVFTSNNSVKDQLIKLGTGNRNYPAASVFFVWLEESFWRSSFRQFISANFSSDQY